MNFKEWFYRTIPHNLSLFYDGEGVFNVSFAGATPSNTGRSKEFEVQGVKFFLEVSIDAKGSTTVTLYAKSSDADIDYELFDVEFYSREEEELEEKKEKPVRIPLYTPALPYTRTTSAVLYELPKRLKKEEQLLPILLVTKDDRYDAYLNDDGIVSKHFLNLCSMQYMKNRRTREIAKATNKETRKFNRIFGNDLSFVKETKQLEVPDFETIGAPEIYGYYKNTKIKKELAIPVFCWDFENGTSDNLKRFIAAVEDYPEVAVSVSHFLTFDPAAICKELGGKPAYFILDYGASYNTTEIRHFVEKTSKLDKCQTIYLGASFTTEELTISKDNSGFNFVLPDKALSAYKALSAKYPALGYGDYCGYDQYTISEFVGGTIPAKVVLHSFADSTILIRRDFDKGDITKDASGKVKTGYRKSMIKLLTNIFNGIIPTKYLDDAVCDADAGLKSYKGKATTPGNIKTLCFRHNIFALMQVAMRLKGS